MKQPLILALVAFVLAALPVQAATLSLTPPTVGLETGKQTPLTLHLDPQGAQVIGSDIILSYPANLKVISVVNKQVFPGNPATIIDNTHGVTKFSLINNFGIYQTAPSDIAVITVEGVSSGNVHVSLTMSPGNTTDTNVVIPGGIDALTKVTGAVLTITDPPGQPDPTTTPTPTPTNNPVPAASVTLPPQASDTARENLAKPRPQGASDNALKNQAAPGFISPLPDDTVKNDVMQPGRTLGATSDLNAATGEARSLLIFLFPSFCLLLGILFLVSALRHPKALARITASSHQQPTPAYAPVASQSLEHSLPPAPNTVTYFHP